MEKRLKKQLLLNVLYAAQNALFPLILAAYLARVLGPEGVGVLAQSRNLASYFSGISLLGLGSYGTRELAKQPGAGKETFRELAALEALLGAVATVGYLAFLLGREEPEGLGAVLTLEVALSMGNWEWACRGREEYGFLLGKALLEKALVLMLTLQFVRRPGDLVRYCRILCLGIAAGQMGMLLRARRWGWLPSRREKQKMGRLNLKKHAPSVAVLMLCGGVVSVYSKMDVTLLGMLGTAEEVGCYVNAYKVVNIVSALASAASGVWLPRLSRCYKTDPTAYRETAARGRKTVAFLAFPCALGLALVAEDVVAVLFGPAFAPAAESLRVLSAVVLVKGMGDMLCYQILISAEKETTVAAGYLLAVAGKLLLNRALIPRFGAVGAAWATVLGEILGNAAMYCTARKLLRWKPDWHFLGRIVLGLAGMALAVGLTGKGENRALGLAGKVPAGAAVYLAIAGGCLPGKKGRKKDGTNRGNGAGSAAAGPGDLAGKMENSAGAGAGRRGQSGTDAAAVSAGLPVPGAVLCRRCAGPDGHGPAENG